MQTQGIYYKVVNIRGIHSFLEEACAFCWSSLADEPKTI